ncbi:MAG: imidazoleglycerol-phosphate dehydratase HisB, partial [Deltaproteobacteria bacterium]
MPRSSVIKRKTTETDITLSMNLDGKGTGNIKTGIPFFDHMLTLFSKHGLFDLKIKAKGDIDVDFHHTVEDVGICLGEAIKKALGDKKGIKRYGTSNVPMMDALATVILDISGRPYLKFDVPAKFTSNLYSFIATKKQKGTTAGFGIGYTKEFLTALSNTAGIDMHVRLHYGEDLHHSIEAIFKALGRALRVAVEKDKRVKGVLSTKGKL